MTAESGFTKRSILLRNFIFFYISFVTIGTIQIIPQIFFMTYYPQKKTFLLSLLLFFGTLGSILGIWMSQKKRFDLGVKLPLRYAMICLISITTVLFIKLFFTVDLTVYFLVFVFFKLCSNYIFNYQDQYFVKITPRNTLNIHTSSLTQFQLLAFLTAPFYFTVFYHHSSLTAVLTLLLGFFTLIPVFNNYGLKQDTSVMKITSINDDQKLNEGDYLFLLYVFFMHSMIIIISATIIYILRDYYKIQNIAVVSGLVIGFVNLSSIVAVFLKGLIPTTSKNEENNISFRLHLVLTILFGSTLLLFYLKLSTSLYYILFPGGMTGTAYGLFLVNTRNYASMTRIDEHKPELLATFNNLPNYSSLLSFISLLIISFVTHENSAYRIPVILSCAILYLGLAVFFLFRVNSSFNCDIY